MPQRLRKMARAIGAVVQRGDNHALVHAVPENATRAVHHRLDKQNSVEFVNVILIRNCVIKSAESMRDFFGKLRTQIVQNRRHDETSRAARTEIPVKSNSVARLVWGSGPSVCFSGGATSPGVA